MTITLYPNSIVYFFSTLFAAGMILVIYLQKSGAGIKLLAASISALNLEMFAVLVESIVKTLPQKIFWSQIEHIGYAAAPTLLLFFALRYTQPNKKFSPILLISAWVMPLTNVLMVWTNARHHLVWTGFVYDDPAVNHLSYLHGTWYWFFLAYTILVFLLVNLVFLKASLRSGEKKRKQYRLLMSGNLIPLVFGLIYGAGWVPLRHLNLFALGSLIACLVIWLAVKKYQFLDPDPIARLKLVSSLPDGVVVLNAQQCVVSANPAAEKLIPEKIIPGEQPPPLLEQLLRVSEDEIFTLEGKNGEIYYLSTQNDELFDSHGETIGRLLIFHDMTRLAQTELKLREKERIEAAEAERRKLALDLHDSVTQSLHGVTLLLDNLRDIIHTENDQSRKEKLIDLTSSGARQALREMRLIIYQLKPVEKSEDFIKNLKTRLSGVEERAGMKISLNLDPDLHLLPGQQEDLSGILMEALNNVIKHAYANTIWINAEIQKNGSLMFSVRDNGKGFDSEKVPSGGMGLQNMTERAAHLGANLDIQSKAGEGTYIQVLLPEKIL